MQQEHRPRQPQKCYQKKAAEWKWVGMTQHHLAQQVKTIPMLCTHAAEEERDLEEATGDMTCDSTSDSSDDADMGTDGSDNGETTEDDRKFMAQARECAKRSKDEQTKVTSP